MENPFARMEILYGPDAMEKLAGSHVAVIGVGGVGGHCAEALARCGVGRFTLIDKDVVSITNMNRQAVAFHSTIGRNKVDVMRDRILDINPGAVVKAIPAFYGPDDTHGLWDDALDAIVDAIDTVSAKVDLALQAQLHGLPCISSMGAGNKLDPTQFEVADIYDTSVCPLCRATRKLARQRGVNSLRVIYSKEMPAQQVCPVFTEDTGRPVPGSVVFVTATAGLLVASEAVKSLLL